MKHSDPSRLHRSATLVAACLTVALLPGAGAATAQSSTEADERAELRQLRERLREAEKETAAIRRQLLEAISDGERLAPALAYGAIAASAFGQRARLGLTVRMTAAEGDDRGAVIEDVREGGPAAEAGLRAGDIITHWNGEPLADDDGTTPSGRSAAARKLFDLARQLEEGERVELRFLRDGEPRSATVLAERMTWAPPPNAAFGIEGDRGLGIGPGRAYVAPRAELPLLSGLGLFGGRWSDLKLLPIGPELGEYFGVERGLLVLEPADDDLLGLRIGDVILSVGDREPRDAAHLMRILRSYEPGEAIRVDVMRKQQRTTLEATVPEHERDARFGLLAPSSRTPASPDARSL